MDNKLLEQYYNQVDTNAGGSSYTFYDVYEVALSSNSTGKTLCGCCILVLCCYQMITSA